MPYLYSLVNISPLEPSNCTHVIIAFPLESIASWRQKDP